MDIMISCGKPSYSGKGKVPPSQVLKVTLSLMGEQVSSQTRTYLVTSDHGLVAPMLWGLQGP